MLRERERERDILYLYLVKFIGFANQVLTFWFYAFDW